MNFLSDLYNFEGKNILIFGAGGHLCSEIATNFAKLNANLFLIDFSYEKLKKLEQKIKLFNKVSNIYLYDVNTTSYNDMSNLNQLINQEHQIDVLINGSGINSPKNYLDIDCYIGITGWITDPKRGYNLHDIIKYIPEDRLLIETDSPYLMPFSYKIKNKKYNEPANLIYILD